MIGIFEKSAFKSKLFACFLAFHSCSATGRTSAADDVEFKLQFLNEEEEEVNPRLDLSYILSKCPDDSNGSVFVRLRSGRSFAVPVDLISIFKQEIVEPAEIQANNVAPPGCKDNPFYVKLINLVIKSREFGGYTVILSDSPGVLMLYNSTARGFERLCRKYPSNKKIMKGITACYGPGEGNRSAAYYRTDPVVHGSNLKPIYWSCPAAMHKDGARLYCTVWYMYDEYFGVRYRYHETNITPDKFIKFDRYIQSQVRSIRYPEIDMTKPRD
ncbi:hypothetical protein [Stappia indica]|uniref:Uncharacterized protein n=1 Tax=Stappia indica TaxID=538381 RepID=A0A857C968_9HYPH|nr:hypothetical protein [Stappia indica]QGZ35052.1 hypothetical protein GH266_11370 [Stappia indica]